MSGGTAGGVYWTFAQLCAAVYTETNRTDLLAETQQAVAAATLKLHTYKGEFFYKDLATGFGTFDTDGVSQAAFIQTLDTAVFPRFRSLCYLRKWDPNYNTSQLNPNVLPPLYGSLQASGYTLANSQIALRGLKVLSPQDLMDDYWTEKVDVCYQAGNTIMIKSSTALSQFQIGFYQYPLIDQQNNFANYTSWIAQEYPYAIVYDAAGTVFSKIGQADAAAMYLRQPDQFGNNGGLAWEHIQSMLNSNIIADGA